MSLLNQFPNFKLLIEMMKRRKVSVYLVGGFLRDYFLGEECVDFDFAVERDALKLARSFARRIKGSYVLLDKERGCARVVKKNKQDLHTYDFADYRAKTFRTDLAHRDFSVNTLAVNLNHLAAAQCFEDIVLDHKNGLKDLKDRKVRMVSVKSFKDDPLRLIRAFSLKAMFGFGIEKKTLDQIKKDKTLIQEVAYERIREELFKILASSRTASTLKAMDRIGLLEEIIPQINIMFKVKQGTYHHLDVWPHSLETVVQLEKIYQEMSDDCDVNDYLDEDLGGGHKRRALLKLGALLHDIGKPETRKREKGRISFHAHERVGRNIVKVIAKQLKISTKQRYALEDMVLWHLRPGYLSNFKKPSDRAIFRYFRDTKDEGAGILLLSLADQRATRGPATTDQDQKHHEEICLALVDRYFKKKKEKPLVRLIGGDDLIKQLKLEPSPLFAKILSEIEEQQALGQIKTKREALALARKILK